MDSLAMRGFVGIDLGREPVPAETTVCRFRHLVDAAHYPLTGGGEAKRHQALQIAVPQCVAQGLKPCTQGKR
jgi:hypothetical protein